MREIPFYMIKNNLRGSPTYRHLSPGGRARWDNIVSVNDINLAEYVVAITHSYIPVPFPKERVLYFDMEPHHFSFMRHLTETLPEGIHRFMMAEGWPMTHWTVNHPYNYFMDNWLDIWKGKDRDLSWVTSNYGDQNPEDPTQKDVQVLPGHQARMQFLHRWLKRFPEAPMDLYGRGLVSVDYDFPCNRGELQDKWDGLAQYRYTLAFENCSEPGYFSEKIADAFLAGCMPIYWGCPNIDHWFPPESMIRVDVYAPDLPDIILDTIDSDLREQNAEAIREAARLVLDRYNVWPVVSRALNSVEASLAHAQ